MSGSLRVLLFKNYLLPGQPVDILSRCLRVLLFKNYLLREIRVFLGYHVWEYCYSRIIFYFSLARRCTVCVWEYCYSRIIFYISFNRRNQILCLRVLLFKNYLLPIHMMELLLPSLRVLLFKNYLLLSIDGKKIFLVWEYCYSRIIFYSFWNIILFRQWVWEYCYSRIIFYHCLGCLEDRAVWEYCYSRIIFYAPDKKSGHCCVWEYCYSRIIFYSLYGIAL